MADHSDQDRLFAAVLSEGTDDAVDAWIGAGPEGVTRLLSELVGQRRALIPESVHQRDVLDNLALASLSIASVYPDRFLAAFPSAEWDANTFVAAGLGGVQRPEATKRLMRLLGHDDKWVRVQAAVSLRGHRHRGLKSVLLTALDDPDELVRHHVQERLAELEA